MPTLDFSGVKDREPLVEGIYELTILEVKEGLTSSKGAEMSMVTFEEPTSQNRIFENFVFQDSTLWKVKEFYEALGIDTDSPVNVDWQDFVGHTVNAKVIQDVYEEKVKNRIKKYMK